MALFGALAAAFSDAPAARSAAAQDWPPFVLVAGLILVGIVAESAGVFRRAGELLEARIPLRARPAFVVLIIASVSAVLNLDTAVVFLTPVLVHASRRERSASARYLYACPLLANAGSTLLPGSNLTNLIVFGGRSPGGGSFVVHMLPVFASAVVVTGFVALRMKAPAGAVPTLSEPEALAVTDRSTVVVAVSAVVVAALCVVLLANPALPVLGTGAAAALLSRRARWWGQAGVFNGLGLPTLGSLFCLAVVAGVIGRAWSYPQTLFHHLGLFVTTMGGAVASVALNNLPAASLLAAHPPRHPYALLVGLDLGPNLFVSGSLAWLLWLRAARLVGERPSLSAATRLGVCSAVPCLVVATGLLTVLAH